VTRSRTEPGPRAAAFRVAGLCAVIAASAVGITLTLAGNQPIGDALRLPWWSLAILFAAGCSCTSRYASPRTPSR
jgi:hypothetical protein